MPREGGSNLADELRSLLTFSTQKLRQESDISVEIMPLEFKRDLHSEYSHENVCENAFVETDILNWDLEVSKQINTLLGLCAFVILVIFTYLLSIAISTILIVVILRYFIDIIYSSVRSTISILFRDGKVEYVEQKTRME